MKQLSQTQLWQGAIGLLLFCGLYAFLFVFPSRLLGIFLSFAYIALIGSWWTDIIEASWFGPRSGIVGRVYGIMAAIFLLGFVQSFFVVWYRVTNVTIGAAFILTAILTFVLQYVYAKKYPASHGQYEADHVYFPGKSMLVLSYVLLWCVGIVRMAQTHAAHALTTPWQALPSSILLIFFALACLSGLFIVSKLKSSIVLFTLVLLSFFVHLSVPFSHQLPWGGDVWRVIAVEETLSAGEAVLPVLFGPERVDRIVYGVPIPEALLIPHKYTYGQFWSVGVLAHRMLGVDFVAINKWLGPLLWSLFVPICLYRIGLTVFSSRRKGLLLAWLSSLIFTLQATGALTLPVSFGMMVFLFLLSLLVESVQKNRRHIGVIIFFACLLPFGYTLHAFIFWFLLISVLFISYIPSRFAEKKRSGQIKQLCIAACIVIGVFFIPVIELLTHVSRFGPSDLLHNIKQSIGQLSGWFYASLIRPHDMLSGNILFNHTPTTSFVVSVFTSWRYHALAASLACWLLALFGWIYALKKTKAKLVIKLMAVLSSTVIGGYMIGWYLMSGDVLFTRRLDALLGFCLLVFALYGGTIIARLLSEQLQYPSRIKRIGVFVLIAGVSWFGTTAFASGPDLRVISEDEYHAALYMSEQQKIVSTPPCVLADTWVLLPLEGVSRGKIVGGGFPIDYQFGQKERITLLGEAVLRPETVADRISAVVSTDTCLVALETKHLTAEQLEKLHNELGAEPHKVGGFSIWQLDLKKSL